MQATASRIDDWFLLEYRGVWGRDALPGSGLSDQVKAHLRAQVAAVPHGRLLFLRRPNRRQRPGLVAFWAHSREGEEEIRRIDLESHEDLRGVDLRAAGERVEHPLFLICTHGKHDRCCARFGRPLYEALRDELDDDWVWQSTHVGGDRFAGNLVCLPEGLYFGRVDRGPAVHILDRYLAREVAPELYRGRSCHTFPVQAAERAIRLESGLLGIGDLRLVGVQHGHDFWRVAFATRDGVTYEADVSAELGELTFLTCSSDTLKRPRHFIARSR